jgi:hypothetical protein
MATRLVKRDQIIYDRGVKTAAVAALIAAMRHHPAKSRDGIQQHCHGVTHPVQGVPGGPATTRAGRDEQQHRARQPNGAKN